jgi:hypothetical protein
MRDRETLWEAAARDARLSAAERTLVLEVCRGDPSLEAELNFLVAHLSANLAGDFLRSFASQLGERGREDPEPLVHRALAEVISADPPQRDGRWGEGLG